MQVNIDKKTGVFLTIIAVLIGALFYVSNKNHEGMMDDMGSHLGNQMDNRMGNSSMNSGTNKKYTGADIMFLQMMIPHHQQAIDMSDMALTRSKNAELLDLAKKIKSAQSAEIVQMKAWLKDAGAGEDMGHSMHDMGGMLSDQEMADLKAASGTTFDKLWLNGMIGHHDGALHMTNMIIDADNAELKAFGEGIIKVQTAEIAQMKEMLKKL